MPNLTKRYIDSIKVEGADKFFHDDGLKGFYIRVFPSGKKVFGLRYRFHGRSQRYKIGYYGIITLEQARQKAIELLGEINNGHNPQEEQIAFRKSATVKEFGEQFIEQHVRIRLKPRTQQEWIRALNKWIYPKIGQIKLLDIGRPEIAFLHQSMSHVPYQANRCKEIMSCMLNHAEMWGTRPENSNPCKYIKKYKEEKRERFLTPMELQRLGRVLKDYEENGGFPSVIHCLKLLILTGCRLSEIQTLKWEYIDKDGCKLYLPDSKTGAKIVYVGEVVIKYLEHIYTHPERPKNNPWVIWGRVQGNRLNDIQNAWQRLRKVAKIEDVRIHDLRHSFASSAVAMGQSLPMIGKLLGHSQVQTTARYAHLASTPVISAATEVSNNIYGLLEMRAI